MRSLADRLLWPMLALVSALVALASLALTDWFALNPCHLCIFQRLLFMVLAVLALLALPRGWFGRLAGGLFALVAVAGIVTAAYQSWLQVQPVGTVTCLSADLGPVERLVEWLGARWPGLFMATGFCEDPGLRILGLSLANWALLVYCALFVASGRALVVRRAELVLEQPKSLS